MGLCGRRFNSGHLHTSLFEKNKTDQVLEKVKKAVGKFWIWFTSIDHFITLIEDIEEIKKQRGDSFPLDIEQVRAVIKDGVQEDIEWTLSINKTPRAEWMQRLQQIPRGYKMHTALERCLIDAILYK